MSSIASSNSQGSCKLADSYDPDIHPSEPRSDPSDYEIGYGKPPRHAQFRKGKSGNPGGRPKAPIGISIKDILDGDQMGKNGQVISRREAIVIRMFNDALAGNQKAFGRFLKLLDRSGLKRTEPSSTVKNVFYESRPMTPEENERFKRNFGLPRDQWT
jgi:Family of unknown function (DUF5681)